MDLNSTRLPSPDHSPSELLLPSLVSGVNVPFASSRIQMLLPPAAVTSTATFRPSGEKRGLRNARGSSSSRTSGLPAAALTRWPSGCPVTYHNAPFEESDASAAPVVV